MGRYGDIPGAAHLHEERERTATSTAAARPHPRIHDDHTINLVDRLVALLILLYAQPLSRIVRLTIADVEHNNRQILLRLGDPAVPIPSPFDQVLIDHLADRPNRTTATNSASGWLFPGRRADQPIHPGSLRLRMHTLSVPILNRRTAAIRHMLQEAPRVRHRGHARLPADVGKMNA